jgi:hypothetical protein
MLEQFLDLAFEIICETERNFHTRLTLIIFKHCDKRRTNADLPGEMRFGDRPALAELFEVILYHRHLSDKIHYLLCKATIKCALFANEKPFIHFLFDLQ